MESNLKYDLDTAEQVNEDTTEENTDSIVFDVEVATVEELKEYADKNGVMYRSNITEKTLRDKVREEIESN